MKTNKPSRGGIFAAERVDMAKSINRAWFDVKSMDGTRGLQARNKESFELLVEEINEIVARARQQGFTNDEKWLIVSVKFSRTWDDNGMMLSEREELTAYATYDNGAVTKI